MTFDSLIAFSLGMTLLALSPGPGLAAVLASSLTSGPRSGYFVIVGLVLADFVFLALAIVGLSALSEVLGPLFLIIKFVGAGYLIYLGWQMYSASSEFTPTSAPSTSSRWKAILTGSVVTLANPKAILFYGAFLPTFFDVGKIGVYEYLVICVIILVISMFVYGTYIFLAAKSLALTHSQKLLSVLRRASGATLMGAGVVVATR